MRKILFGTIVFFSLAFLASCGGGSSGSKGATGATGATGAAGADGTGTAGSSGTGSGGTVPGADANLTITGSATLLDSDMDLGQIATRTLVVAGLDNLSTTRTKYYGYLGTSSTTKSEVVSRDQMVPSLGATGDWPIYNAGAIGDDSYLITHLGIDLGAGDGSITHLIICPGNDAGDALIANCASAALNDRGWGKNDNATDNRSAMLVGADTTSGSTSFYVLANSAARDTTSGGPSPDNESSAATITSDTKSSTIVPTIGTYSTAVGPLAAVVDFAVEGTTQYLLTNVNNGNLWSRTTGDFTQYLDNVTNGAVVAQTDVVLKSDGTNMIAAIASGARGSRLAVISRIDNTTSSAQIASVTLHDNATALFPAQYCAAVGGGYVVAASDNQTFEGTTSANSGRGANIVWYHGAYTASAVTTVGDNVSATFFLDNTTSTNDCDIAYGHVSGTFWYMVDNGSSGTSMLVTTDNATSWNPIANGDNASILIGTAGGINGIDSISLTVDPVDKGLVVCANDTGTLVVKKFQDNTSWVDLAPTATSIVAGTDVDCAYNSDGTEIGVTSIAPGTASQAANFQIFYDE